jgi:Domain of unknown function (DUF4166)
MSHCPHAPPDGCPDMASASLVGSDLAVPDLVVPDLVVPDLAVRDVAVCAPAGGGEGVRLPAPLDLARIVGPAAWGRLPASLRRRFAAGHSPVRYDGTMDLDRSFIGGWFARLAKPFGTPLPVRRASCADVTVAVREQNGGVVWERRFGSLHYVRSVKFPGFGNTVVECTDGGLGMVLDVSVQDGALVFTSRNFFLSIGSWCLPVPALLTPGTCRVEHRTIDETRFTFSLTMTHPLWGTTFRQSGIFHDPAECVA